jgi:hypothetical protein
MDRWISVACKISRSAFSDDRVFRVALADGSEYIGAASAMYFSKPGGTPLEAGEPPADRPITGQVVGRTISVLPDTVVVSLPDGEMAKIKSSQVRKEAPPHVSVES